MALKLEIVIDTKKTMQTIARWEKKFDECQKRRHNNWAYRDLERAGLISPCRYL